MICIAAYEYPETWGEKYNLDMNYHRIKHHLQFQIKYQMYHKVQVKTNMLMYNTHRTTESNTLQGHVTPAMDSERGYTELSLLYMECRFNIYSIFEDIFK